MERTISQEERIRRAEEIYNRRREYYNTPNRTRYFENVDKDKKPSIKLRMTKKMAIQFLICILLYSLIYVFQNSNFFFSKDVNKKINEFMSYDVQLSNLYNQTISYFNSEQNIFKKIFSAKQDEKNVQNTDNTNSENSNTENPDGNGEQKQEQTNTQIGGAEENIQVCTKSQNELDVDFIKQNYNIIWPLHGTITSKFGPRTPTNIVTANHYGLDISGNIGDKIIAAMDGTVTVSSEVGEYGKHIKIENGEVSTLYAHCSKLCVETGNVIKQGTIIAEVGQTGRATGPHLHFEVKRDDRAIDPESILNS